MAGPGPSDELTLGLDLHDYADDNLDIKSSFTYDMEIKHDPETDELFDDVVTSRIKCENGDAKNVMVDNVKSGDECAVTEGPGSIENAASPVKKFYVYIGNLTWWTTDQEIEDLLVDIGVEDLIDLKIFDNRSNGQSKGYCNVCVGSERSIRLIHEKLPKRELYEKRIMVAAPSKVATAQFEAQSECKPRAQQPNPAQPGCNGRGPAVGAGVPPQAYGLPTVGPRMIGTPRGNNCLSGPVTGNSPTNTRLNIRPPHQHHTPPGPPPVLPHMNYGPQRSHALPPFHPHQRSFRPFHHPPGHPPCAFPPSPPVMDHHQRGPPPPHGDWTRGHPGPHYLPGNSQHCPPPGPMGMGLPPPPQQILRSPQQGVSTNEPSPAPHVNPAFFQPQSQYSSPVAARSPIETLRSKSSVAREQKHKVYESPSRSPDESKQARSRYNGLSATEIDEIMGRNRTVSSTAISRAVADAAKGDFASAIETLVTAISLIKQSRVANDERCKILIASLQDTLHGVESKSYGRARVRTRSKSRSRSRERERIPGRGHKSRHHHHHRRSRSRSFERSRSRERYFNRRRSRTRSRSSSRGRECDRNSSKHEDRDCYRDHHDREKYSRESERERRDNTTSKSSRNSSSRSHERSEDHEHTEHRSSRR